MANFHHDTQRLTPRARREVSFLSEKFDFVIDFFVYNICYINSFALRRCDWNIKSEIFRFMSRLDILSISCENAPGVNATRPHWWLVSIGSGAIRYEAITWVNFGTIWHHKATVSWMSYNSILLCLTVTFKPCNIYMVSSLNVYNTAYMFKVHISQLSRASSFTDHHCLCHWPSP